MITTIFFDIGNVLVRFDHSLIWQRLAPLSPLAVEELRRRIKAADVMNLHETGQLAPQEFFQAVQALAELPASLAFADFCVMWADIFSAQQPIIELAQTLQQRYALLLLSNVGEIHWNWIAQRYPIFRQIEKHILSFQVGCLKPAPAIYHAALQLAGASPAQCAYIDDIAEYVAASRTLGIHGIHYQSPAQLQSSLRMLQIECSRSGQQPPI
jgi:FMN phosphatase YigB (HAD superfamily)